MTVFVFLGPTLALDEARQILPDAIFLPPVGSGDVLAIMKYRPSVIAIIDGYFGARPSVWHKEILYALSQGVQVYGAASMGALRAAELDRHGMRGFGKVYASYSSGDINDDDEVCVVHAPSRLRYALGSTALVDFRHAFGEAVDNGLVSPALAERALGKLKELHFSDRSWDRLRQEISAGDPAPADCPALAEAQDRLAGMSAKAEDAKGLLRLLARGDEIAGSAPPETAQLLTSALTTLVGRTLSRPLPHSGDWVRRSDLEGRDLRFAPQFYLLTSIASRILSLSRDAAPVGQAEDCDHILTASLAIYVALQLAQCFGSDPFPQDGARAGSACRLVARRLGAFIRAARSRENADASASAMKRMTMHLALLRGSPHETVHDVLARHGGRREDLAEVVRTLVSIESFIMSFQPLEGNFPTLEVDWWQKASELVNPAGLPEDLSDPAIRASRAQAMLATGAKSYHLVRFGFPGGRSELETQG